MGARFQFTPQATEDLDALWWFIAAGNPAAADRVESEIIATCRRLARHPRMGTKRNDLTPLAAAFLDRPKVSQLRDRLPARNCAAAGGRRVARQARPEGCFEGALVTMNAWTRFTLAPRSCTPPPAPRGFPRIGKAPGRLPFPEYPSRIT